MIGMPDVRLIPELARPKEIVAHAPACMGPLRGRE